MNFSKRTMNFVKGQRGFSLNELLVALVIMSVVSTAIYGVFSISSRSYTTQGVAADVQQSV
jgi:prepilin-type N-terminal cleavage/methylation domain-containing protein